MFNRQKIKVNVMAASDKRDSYGYKSEEYTVIKTIEAAVMLYSQSNTEDIRYKDATHICLTYDKTLTDKMRLETENAVYDVMLVNNEGRLSQIYLKEVLG